MSELHLPSKQPTPARQSHALSHPPPPSVAPPPEPPVDPPEPALPPVDEPPVPEPPLPPVAEPPEPPVEEPPIVVVLPPEPAVGLLDVVSSLHATHTNPRESPITATYPARMFDYLVGWDAVERIPPLT